jgi:hypothetical protein
MSQATVVICIVGAVCRSAADHASVDPVACEPAGDPGQGRRA